MPWTVFLRPTFRHRFNKAPPPVVRNWTACYLGINGGYGWANKDFVG